MEKEAFRRIRICACADTSVLLTVILPACKWIFSVLSPNANYRKS